MRPYGFRRTVRFGSQKQEFKKAFPPGGEGAERSEADEGTISRHFSPLISRPSAAGFPP